MASFFQVERFDVEGNLQFFLVVIFRILGLWLLFPRFFFMHLIFLKSNKGPIMIGY